MFQTSLSVTRIQFEEMRAFALVGAVKGEEAEVRAGGVEAGIRGRRLARRMEDLDVERLSASRRPDHVDVRPWGRMKGKHE